MTPSDSLSFVKMHGAGNDFVLFDNRSLQLTEKQIQEIAPRISDRKFGVGSDGVIALNYDDTKEADLVMLYKNPDGSDAGMCGNGARCFASFAVTLGAPASFSFRVHDKVYRTETNNGVVKVDFPLETEVKTVKIGQTEYLDIYTNTEHIVCSVAKSALADEEGLVKKGRYLREHQTFSPKGTNVNFLAGLEKNQLELQTYERGVENLTYACGTGAIASALAWHHLQDGASGTHRFQINVKGGTLFIEFTFSDSTNKYSSIKLEGPTAFVFEGRFYF